MAKRQLPPGYEGANPSRIKEIRDSLRRKKPSKKELRSQRKEEKESRSPEEE